MKIRNGLVSNSSSSSFIVGIKDGRKTSTKIKVEMEINLSEYGEVITSIEDLIKRYTEYHGCNIDELNDNNDYVAAKKIIEAGGIVIVGSFSDQSEKPIENMLCELGLKSIVKDKNIVVIEGEGGY